MKHSRFTHSTNLLLIVILIWIISIACKNSASNENNSLTLNTNTPTNKDILGELFTANEVCKYPDIPVIKKYGGFTNSSWGKNKGVDLGIDFSYLCTPYPSRQITLSNEISNTEIQIAYDARGNRAEGAHTIYMEYRAVTEAYWIQFKQLDQKYKKDVLIPLVSAIVKKALKQNPSLKILQKIQNGKTGSRNMDSCEQVGNGYVCVDNFEKEQSDFVELYIFANKDALNSHLAS